MMGAKDPSGRMLGREVPVVIQKCINPACGEPFLYFRNGKIYRIDRRDAMPHVQRGQEQGKAEHFWLCGRCSTRLGVVLAPDGSVEVTEAGRVPRDQPVQELSSSLTRGEALTCTRQPSESEGSAFVARSHAGARTPPILVLDVEFITLALIEEILHDSGLSAITCTSIVEAINLLGTGLFDVFIVIDRPVPSHTAAIRSVLAAACFYCESCLCWSTENVKQLCSDFVEGAKRKPQAERGEVDVYDAVLAPRPEREVSGHRTSGATA